VVKVEKTEKGFRLQRNGKPYFIKGAGGSAYLKQLKEAGGNSIRTWSAQGIGKLLDDAHAQGLTVTVGFWLGHERHGFKYDNQKAVQQQFDSCRKAVLKHKDHPALLMWAVGNEMEGHTGSNVAIWKAINDIAKMCKKEDPNHPTMTVVAEIGGEKVPNFNTHCPNVDILGINSYGGLRSIPKRYAKAGGVKPYIITEFGPLGHWEVGKTKWKAPIEMTSTEKGEFYKVSYKEGILGQPLSLGAYAFVWGDKMEATATWYGMFLRGGAKLAAVDVMTELWRGEPPPNRCPVITKLKLDKDAGLNPGDLINATATITDPENQPLRVSWVLRRESGMYGEGGDAQPDQPDFPDSLVKSDSSSATLKIPASGGGYRLFVYAFDGNGGAAVANVPLFVLGKVLPPPPPRPKLPFYLYSDTTKSEPYIPSGYMGNAGAIQMESGCTEKPFKGETCLKVVYGADDNWGGVVWQSPANDWGDRPGGFNLTGANEVEFWARGKDGGEVVSFSMGILKGKKYSDSEGAELKNLKLRKTWTKYRIPLDGRDVSCIKTGFSWSLSGQGKPVTFYLDEICYKK
jgi:hypothetical protein